MADCHDPDPLMRSIFGDDDDGAGMRAAGVVAACGVIFAEQEIIPDHEAGDRFWQRHCSGVFVVVVKRLIEGCKKTVIHIFEPLKGAFAPPQFFQFGHHGG